MSVKIIFTPPKPSLPLSFEHFSTDFIDKDGILFSKKESKISYPVNGNDKFFQIEDNSFWYKHRSNCIIECVKKYCPDNIFFDIGGGNGFIAKELEDTGIPTVMVEPDFRGCANAKKRKLKNIICSNLENIPLDRNSISSVGLFDVIEHIEDDITFLTLIHSFLKENGFVFITVPAYKMLWSNEDFDDGHFRRYTIRDIENKLKGIGFSIKYSTYLFSILPIAIFLFRTVPSKLGLNKNSYNIDKHQTEHKKNGIIDAILNQLWEYEFRKIKKGKKILFGASCFVIATKSD